MGFHQRLGELLVADHVSHVHERRSGEGEFPVEDSGDTPVAVDLVHQQVRPAEIGMHQAVLAGQQRQAWRPIPHMFAHAVALGGVEAALGFGRAQAAFDKIRGALTPGQQGRSDDESRIDPAGAIEFERTDAGECFADGASRLGDLARVAPLLELAKRQPVLPAHDRMRRDVLGFGGSGVEDFRHGHAMGHQAVQVDLLPACGRVSDVDAQYERFVDAFDLNPVHSIDDSTGDGFD